MRGGGKTQVLGGKRVWRERRTNPGGWFKRQRWLRPGFVLVTIVRTLEVGKRGRANRQVVYLLRVLERVAVEEEKATDLYRGEMIPYWEKLEGGSKGRRKRQQRVGVASLYQSSFYNHVTAPGRLENLDEGDRGGSGRGGER